MTITDDNTNISAAEAKRLKHNEEMRAWRSKNAEHNYAYNREYAKKNSDKWKEYRKRDNEKKKEARKLNPDKHRAYNREYRHKNPEKMRRLRRRYRERNAEKLHAKEKIWRIKANRKGMESARRRAELAHRIPSWSDLKAIDMIYKECQRISKETGIKHNVDHIYPLKGKTVSGLHVPNNLRIIPAIDNLRKHNKHPDEFSF